MNISRIQLAKMIDHTILKPESIRDDILRVCEEAKSYNFASVVVNPTHVTFVSQNLKNTDIKTCTVIGFPLGATTTETKVFEGVNAIKNGVDELDMVINIGALKFGDFDYVLKDIKEVVDIAEERIVKVILETGLLTKDEIVKACQIVKSAGAHFVKTSTGFGPGGATIENIQLMRETVGPDMGVKASGGIRTYNDAINMIQAGATRLGASAGVNIIEEFPNR